MTARGALAKVVGVHVHLDAPQSADSSNETVMWVYPDGPDPPVHGLTIGGETGVWDERFTDYLEWALESYQSVPR